MAPVGTILLLVEMPQGASGAKVRQMSVYVCATHKCPMKALKLDGSRPGEQERAQ